jgi:predicted permease
MSQQFRAAGVIALFAAMPTGANAYIFAAQYKRLVNPVSGAVALGTLRAAVTLPVVVMMIVAELEWFGSDRAAGMGMTEGDFRV